MQSAINIPRMGDVQVTKSMKDSTACAHIDQQVTSGKTVEI